MNQMINFKGPNCNLSKFSKIMTLQLIKQHNPLIVQLMQIIKNIIIYKIDKNNNIKNMKNKNSNKNQK